MTTRVTYVPGVLKITHSYVTDPGVFHSKGRSVSVVLMADSYNVS